MIDLTIAIKKEGKMPKGMYDEENPGNEMPEEKPEEKTLPAFVIDKLKAIREDLNNNEIEEAKDKIDQCLAQYGGERSNEEMMDEDLEKVLKTA